MKSTVSGVFEDPKFKISEATYFAIMSTISKMLILRIKVINSCYVKISGVIKYKGKKEIQ